MITREMIKKGFENGIIYDIREILEKVDQEGLENLVRNAVAYSQSNNNSKVNWIAQELFADVIPDEMIAEIFNKE